MYLLSVSVFAMGRAPHGARGLKSPLADPAFEVDSSRPAWGAWIEIKIVLEGQVKLESRPAWGAWIEILSWSLFLGL